MNFYLVDTFEQCCDYFLIISYLIFSFYIYMYNYICPLIFMTIEIKYIKMTCELKCKFYK